VEDGRLLLVRGAAAPRIGLWSVPAVEVATDEPLVAAVVRGVDEAAGGEAVCEGLLGYFEDLDGEKHRVHLAFEVTVLADSHLAPRATWVSLEDVAELPLVQGLVELLAERGILQLIA